MGKKKPENGGAGRRRRKRRSPGEARGQQPPPNQLDIAGPGTSSRLLLTHVIREGALWEVFVAATAPQKEGATVHLEFVHKARDTSPVRYSRPVFGPLLEALHTGGPMSRRDLERELEQAIRDAAPADGNPTR
jgi:hypothetical protein